MTDERPRPQFGEYATREEQLAHIKAPTPEQLDPSTADVAPSAAVAGPLSLKSPAPADLAALAERRRQFNIFASVAFIAFGLFEVVANVPTFLSMSVLINAQLSAFGSDRGVTIDTYPLTDVSVLAGYALIALWIVLWLASALWSWSRIRRGKNAVWVPILAGVIANLAVGIVVTVLIFDQPNIAQQLIDAVR